MNYIKKEFLNAIQWLRRDNGLEICLKITVSVFSWKMNNILYYISIYKMKFHTLNAQYIEWVLILRQLKILQ